MEKLVTEAQRLLDQIQNDLFQKARRFLEEHTQKVSSYEDFKRALQVKGGFLKACWCSLQECEERIKEETGATIRAIPFEQEEVWSTCIYCGKPADKVVYFARAY
jgi:prolyl-tRNA synthetase